MQKEISENTIFIGGKPFMNYVTGIVMQFTTHNATEVVVEARGKFISRAVDIVEMSKRFLKEKMKVKNTLIGSQMYENLEGKTSRVSSIKIILERC